jgi:anti-sigma regulatory factor (Ser/Thr protein kinase)
VKEMNLNIPGNPELLSVATTFSEIGSRSLGLGAEEALALTLATEEIFTNLARLGLPTDWVLQDGSHHVTLSVSFPQKQIDLASLNLVAKVDLANEGESPGVGWLLAAKSVDRFQIENHSHDKTTFVLTKKRYYPEAEPSTTWPKPEQRVAEYREPNEQELALFCARLVKSEDPSRLLGFLRRPGRLFHMMTAGEAVVRLAFSARGEPLGGAVLELLQRQMAFLHGPYLFEQPPETGASLFRELVRKVAKSALHGIVSMGTEELYRDGDMEYLGEQILRQQDGSHEVQRMFYRHITEDEGSVVWVAPCLQAFLEETYDRLELARGLESWQPCSQVRAKHSVLSTDLRREKNLAVFRPLLEGSDLESNLKVHIEQLRADGFVNFMFEMDLGESRQMAFAEPLIASGFRPQLLVPEAGRGDLLYFQLPVGDDS